MTDTDQSKLLEARQSFTGKTLTEAQFTESWALAEIMERSIRHSGAFKDKLGDYANAFARTERFEAMQGETIIRDMFKARYGETMNQMREKLMEREHTIRDVASPQALDHANRIEPLIREGDTMPFYRAYDREASAFAEKHGITEAGAKSMMKEAYGNATGGDLYQDGKAAEKEHHLPRREAEKQARQAARDQSPQDRGAQSRSQPRPR